MLLLRTARGGAARQPTAATVLPAVRRSLFVHTKPVSRTFLLAPNYAYLYDEPYLKRGCYLLFARAFPLKLLLLLVLLVLLVLQLEHFPTLRQLAGL